MYITQNLDNDVFLIVIKAISPGEGWQGLTVAVRLRGLTVC